MIDKIFFNYQITTEEFFYDKKLIVHKFEPLS
jgi:hypothetical protein